MGKILEVKNLTVHIKTHKGVVQAVRGVDFYLNEQETLAVVGESGSGKTTLLNILAALDAAGQRKRDRHDLPGSNDLPEPYHEGWKTDRGNAQGALQGDEQGRPQGKSH